MDVGMSNKNGDRVCDWCEEIYSTYTGEGVFCTNYDCWKGWCSQECADEDGYKEDSCAYCRLEKVDAEQMLQWVMTTAKWTRDQLMEFVLEDMRKERHETVDSCKE